MYTVKTTTIRKQNTAWDDKKYTQLKQQQQQQQNTETTTNIHS